MRQPSLPRPAIRRRGARHSEWRYSQKHLGYPQNADVILTAYGCLPGNPDHTLSAAFLRYDTVTYDDLRKMKFVELLQRVPCPVSGQCAIVDPYSDYILHAFCTILAGDSVAKNVFFLLQRQVCTRLDYGRKVAAQYPHGRMGIRWRKIIRLVEQEKPSCSLETPNSFNNLKAKFE